MQGHIYDAYDATTFKLKTDSCNYTPNNMQDPCTDAAPKTQSRFRVTYLLHTTFNEGKTKKGEVQ
jgi:hypothetical protein